MGYYRIYAEFYPVRHFYQQPGEGRGVYSCQVFKLLQFRENSWQDDY